VFSPQRIEVLELIGAGVRAPSADNQHHVRFVISDHGLEMRADAFFLEGHEQHRRLLTLISFGSIAENLRLALATRGWAYQPAWFPEPADPALLLRIDWSALASGAASDPLVSFIGSRHTNRRFFRGPKLSDDQSRSLESAAVSVPGVAIEWLDAAPRRRAALCLIRLAETARFRNQRLHAEMFESIDFAAGWHSPTNERLAPATLEVEPFLRIPFASMRHWRVMRALNVVGMHRMLGLRAGDLPARLSPHLIALTSSLPADDAALAIGAAFQRVWLAAEQAGVALQPMVASAILATDDAPDRGIGEATRRLLQRGWHELIGNAKPYVVFRLGRARRPRIVSGRRPVEDYLA
jgi:hypothetical protein